MSLAAPDGIVRADDGPALKENHFAQFRREFAGLVGIDAVAREISVVSESTGRIVKLPLHRECEFWRRWAPAEPADFAQGLRLWIWTTPGEDGKPGTVRVVADEISEMAIHDRRLVFAGAVDGKWTFRPSGKPGAAATVKLTPADALAAAPPAADAEVFVQTAFNAGRRVVEVLSAAQLEKARKEQYERQEGRLAAEGVPALVHLSDDLSGELLLSVGRPGDRLVRALEPGAEVQIVSDVAGAKPVPAKLVEVQVRGHRSRVMLLAEGRLHARLAGAATARLKFARPKLPADPEDPPDADRFRSREERLIWLQSNIHCTCPIEGDTCAGNFFTLLACNSHLCAEPVEVQKAALRMIEAGRTDRQILTALREMHGSKCCRPHLRP